MIPTCSRSEKIVSDAKMIMNLPYRNRGRECIVRIGDESYHTYHIPEHDFTPITILLPPLEGIDSLTRGLSIISRSLAYFTLTFGGLLIHGALIEYLGNGLILMAKSGIGKSTAAKRVPPPWKALSDDLTLVIQKEGRLFAHPFPTWSRFQDNGPGGIWDLEHAIPVKGIFQLKRSHEDFIEPYSQAQAIVGLFGSAKHALGFTTQRYNPEDGSNICRIILKNADNIVKMVPVNILNISLNGKFWEKIREY